MNGGVTMEGIAPVRVDVIEWLNGSIFGEITHRGRV